jgi:putative FmdB family regulatory protein
MPTYEYECKRCHAVFEAEHSIREVLTTHECGGDLVRLISSSNFALKGTGWYTTDYGAQSDRSVNSTAD